MGCLMSKKSNQQQSTNESWTSNKTYSWSHRDRSQLMKYTIENESNSLKIHLPGEINGEQFIIQNCNNSTICLYDFSNTVMIDDCKNCTFFIGPVIGSLFIRNCEDCRLISASQQFRARDCKNLYLFIFCSTQPAIESSHNLIFACFSANYNSLLEQFDKANLKVFNNEWFKVYDFSIDNREKHWSIDSSSNKIDESFRSIPLDNNQLNLSFNHITSLVPITKGIVSFDSIIIEDSDESIFMIIIYSHSSLALYDRIENYASKIIRNINLNIKELALLMTRYLDSDALIKSVLTRISNGIEDEMMLMNDDKIQMAPNQSIVLIYSGEYNNKNLNDILKQTFNSSKKFKYKAIEKNHDQFLFNDCFTFIFNHGFNEMK